MKIQMDKAHTYRNGEPARVVCVDRPHQVYSVVSMTEQGDLLLHEEDGTHALFAEYNLVEVQPFTKDDPVMVRNHNGKWFRRYYSHAGDKEHYVFVGGRTSWTTNNTVETVDWDECRRPTNKELEQAA